MIGYETINAKVLRISGEELGGINHDNWISFIGFKDGKPYVIYTSYALDGSSNSLDKKVKEGIIHIGKDFENSEKLVFVYIKEINSIYSRDDYRIHDEGILKNVPLEYSNLNKIVSGLLKNNIPVKEIKSILKDIEFHESKEETSFYKDWKELVLKSLEDCDKPNL